MVALSAASLTVLLPVVCDRTYVGDGVPCEWLVEVLVEAPMNRSSLSLARKSSGVSVDHDLPGKSRRMSASDHASSGWEIVACHLYSRLNSTETALPDHHSISRVLWDYAATLAHDAPRPRSSKS